MQCMFFCAQMTIAKTCRRLRRPRTAAYNTSRDVRRGLPCIRLPYGKLNLCAVRSASRDSRRHERDSGGMKKEQTSRNARKAAGLKSRLRMPRTCYVRHKRRRYDQKWRNQSVTTCPVSHAVASHALYASGRCIRTHLACFKTTESHGGRADGLV